MYYFCFSLIVSRANDVYTQKAPVVLIFKALQAVAVIISGWNISRCTRNSDVSIPFSTAELFAMAESGSSGGSGADHSKARTNASPPAAGFSSSPSSWQTSSATPALEAAVAVAVATPAVQMTHIKGGFRSFPWLKDTPQRQQRRRRWNGDQRQRTRRRLYRRPLPRSGGASIWGVRQNAEMELGRD